MTIRCARCGGGCVCSETTMDEIMSTTVDAAPREVGHPHLTGIERAPDPVLPEPDRNFWCVIFNGKVYGPYLTQAAAESLVPELDVHGFPIVIPMELR